MTDPTDPDELLVQAAAALATGDLREANRLMDLAEMATAARLARLTGGPTHRIVRTVDVDTTGQPSIAKRAASRSRRKHEAQALLYNAGLTIQALANALGEKRSRVSHWMAEPDASKNFPRPVPRVHADAMERGLRIAKADGKVVTLRIPRSVWGRIAE